MRRYIPIFIPTLALSLTLLLMAGCTDNDEWRSASPAESHPELIGRAVNFNASHADPFMTRATYRHDGSFNEQDIMYIYRQYSDNGGISFDAATQSYRCYWLATRYAAGTSFALETYWQPKQGAWGYNPDTDAYPTGKRGLFKQEEADSLTWENGKTVRFRAWSRSNVAGAISNCTTSSSSSAQDKANARNRYYPDFCVSEWVTVSGPTLDVPLTLKHQGCRIGFTARAGNELYRAEICTDWEDYKRQDNSDTNEHDTSEYESGKTDEEAKAEAARVVAVYNRMCMPAGVDTRTALLQTMTQDMFNSDDVNLGDLTGRSNADNTVREVYDAEDGLVTIGVKDSADIRTDVQRPQFCSNDGRLYMITIPYDMSSEAEGEALVLPACTRIKVWLYDVNNGDKAATPGTEANYHIFTLGDVRENGDSGEYLFPEGMELTAGKSYLFSVGYHYDHFTLTPADNFSWDQQDAEAGDAANQAQEQPTIDFESDDSYKWWKDAIKEAIPTSANGKRDYLPEFHISTQKEFLEFIKLVNGTAPGQIDGLTILLDPTRTFNNDNPATKADYRWYRSTDVSGGKLRPSVNAADSVTHAQAKEEGYIFYEHYYPANATQAAYSIEDYLRGPYNFYNDNLREHWTVYLDNDLDLYDWQLDPIGNEMVDLGEDGSHPFRGVFDGQLHTLRNINVEGGYMFKHCYGAAIRNLKIETTHNFMLLHTAEAPNEAGYGAYIVGVSIKAPATDNPIANTLIGSSYVVGCKYEGHITLKGGDTNGAMVGSADNLTMYANLMAATGLPHNSGALLGEYSGSNQFFVPQSAKTLSWGRFMANYYLMDRYSSNNSQILHAVGNIPDAYRPQEYIRGALAWVLKAKNDNMISGDVPYERLSTELMRKGYYGLAPWKAMNYALYQYNLVGARVSEPHNCKAHYVNNSVGYANTFPELKSGEPNSVDDETGYRGRYDTLNLLELFN